MARQNTGYLFTDTPDTTFISDLQAALTVNLAEWSVGALFPYTNTTYFVLSHPTSNAEILIGGNTAAGIAPNDIFHPDWRANTGLGSFFNYKGFAFAPEGGFADSLSAANDPKDAAFWTALAFTPTKAVIFLDHDSGVAQDFYFIEDDTDDTFAIIITRDGSVAGTYMDLFLFGTDINDQTMMLPADMPKPYGFLYNGSTNGGGGGAYYARSWHAWAWENNGTIHEMGDYGSPYAMCNIRTLTPSTSGPGTDIMLQRIAYSSPYHPLYGFLKQEHIVGSPVVLNKFLTKFGDDITMRRIQIIDTTIWPWADNLATPTP